MKSSDMVRGVSLITDQYEPPGYWLRIHSD